MRTIGRARWVLLSGMMLISAPRVARAEPPPPASSGVPGAPPASAPSVPSATSLPATPYPYASWLGRPDLALPPPDLPEPSRKRWYGWQTLTVFGGSTLLMAASVAIDSMRLEGDVALGGFGMAFSGYALGGPIVHWAHGNVGKGFASLGMNVAGIMSGFASGLYAVGGHDGNVTLGFALGGSIGSLVATILDTTLLTYDQRGPAREDASARQRQPMALVPTLDIRKDRASLGFIGAF